MTTTGERLVEISTLDTDTAMNHFLNISTGDGGGLVVVGEIDIVLEDGITAMTSPGLTAVVSDPVEVVVDTDVQVDVEDDGITGEVC